jgi:hypothetical protein
VVASSCAPGAKCRLRCRVWMDACVGNSGGAPGRPEGSLYVRKNDCSQHVEWLQLPPAPPRRLVGAP